MVSKDSILENLEQLPQDRWLEVLDFIQFLQQKEAALEALEDAEDIADAEAALAEEGFISLAEVKRELGLK
jgi:CMP-2-keto-3-deoxyoctulosonic acid synthetase